MKYETALKVAADTVAHLQDEDGNMSEAEVICQVAALDYAVDQIARRNAVSLPGRAA